MARVAVDPALVDPVVVDPAALDSVPMDSVPMDSGACDSGVSGRALPVLPVLSGLFPYGSLQRGSTVSITGSPDGSGATSLTMAVVAGPSAGGSWTAVVGVPDLGFAAAAAMGVALARTAVVPAVPPGSWATVVAAFVDAFDIVVVAPEHRPGSADIRRLRARVRERGAVLIEVKGRRLDVDVRLTVTASEWDGLGRGHGHLRTRRMSVTSGGRGAASRPRRVDLWLPGPNGGIPVMVSDSDIPTSETPVPEMPGIFRMDEWRGRGDRRGGTHARGVVS